MALSARPVNVSSAPSASPSGRIPSGMQGGESMAGTPVDGIDARAAIQSNTHYGFDGYSEWARRQLKPPKYEPLTNTSGQFETFSSLFVNLLDSQQNGMADTDVRSEAKRLNPSFVNKAIRAYEGTSIVIHGMTKPLGRSLSISM